MMVPFVRYTRNVDAPSSPSISVRFTALPGFVITSVPLIWSPATARVVVSAIWTVVPGRGGCVVVVGFKPVFVVVGATETAGPEEVGNGALAEEEALLDDVEIDKAAPPPARRMRAATDPQAA